MRTREKLVAIFEAAIAAVSPHGALLRNLALSGYTLKVGDHAFDASSVVVAGGGKGAAPMAQALEELLGSHIDRGFVAVKYGHTLPLQILEMGESAHPEPDAASEAAGLRCLELARSCGEKDLFVVMLTGGASALLSVPAPGLTLEDLRIATSALLACGADISELNTVRKHLSAIAGGRLAEAAWPAQTLAVIVSDVIGDDLSVIASGPTSPDASTYTDCLRIIQKYALAISPRALDYLRDGAAGLRPETPKAGAPCFSRVLNVIVAGNAQALDAAAQKAKALGMNVKKEPEPMRGEARAMAKNLMDRAKGIAETLRPGDWPVCLLAGGETTVTLRGHGLGGRNQEMALAASLELADEPRISALFAGTDGTDGPTDAAGGFAPAGLPSPDAEKFLADNDSYHALRESGDLFRTGPTLTNVMDLAIIIIDPPAAEMTNA